MNKLTHYHRRSSGVIGDKGGSDDKSDKNRTGMSQMKDKNSPHTKLHQNEVGEDDLG